jgi:hypothetical protein
MTEANPNPTSGEASPGPLPIREWTAVDAAKFREDIVPMGQPAVLRGLGKEWPLVRHFNASPREFVDYLIGLDSGELVMTTIVPPEERGRMVYKGDLKELNHRNSLEKLPNVLRGLLKLEDEALPPGVFIGGLNVAQFPGLERENCTDLVSPEDLPHLWIGNAATVSAHFDAADNLAFVVAGRRRFTLFPPDQVGNLYIGPFDVTPAGLPISLVSHDEPDLERYPRFREALAVAQWTELGPGDAIYIPYLWWHGVKSLEPLNMLVNFWWYGDEIAAAHPYGALLRATFELYRDMPPEHRAAWKHMYDHWVFATDGDPLAHLPAAQRTARAKLDNDAVTRFRRSITDLLA